MSIDFFNTCDLNPEGGFSDLDLKDICIRDPVLDEKVSEAARLGYSYGGATQGGSKAYTDVFSKKIYISKDKTLQEACLSLLYESINAKNGAKLQEIHKTFLYDEGRQSESRALEYARIILSIEAEAMYAKCLYAISSHTEELIKNPKYLEIVKAHSGHPKITKSKLLEEMLINGKVHKGTIPALDYYKNQYFVQQRAAL